MEALAPPANRPEATRQAAAAIRTREPTVATTLQGVTAPTMEKSGDSLANAVNGLLSI
jgi:hypothetical protein